MRYPLHLQRCVTDNDGVDERFCKAHLTKANQALEQAMSGKVGRLTNWLTKHLRTLGRISMAELFSRLVVGLALILIQPAVDAAAPSGVGRPAPDFAVQSLDGRRTIRLSDFRGHRVLIFTWASW